MFSNNVNIKSLKIMSYRVAVIRQTDWNMKFTLKWYRVAVKLYA
jgi:hypothetical protein